MTTEHTTIRAVVRALDGNCAFVEVAQEGCGRCHEEGGCGGQQLTQMFCSGAKTYKVDNTVGAKIGELVTIGVAPGSISHSANLAYILPLTVAFAGAFLGMALAGNGGAILGAACGLIVSFLYVRFRSRREADNSTGRPYIISRS